MWPHQLLGFQGLATLEIVHENETQTDEFSFMAASNTLKTQTFLSVKGKLVCSLLLFWMAQTEFWSEDMTDIKRLLQDILK